MKYLVEKDSLFQLKCLILELVKQTVEETSEKLSSNHTWSASIDIRLEKARSQSRRHNLNLNRLECVETGASSSPSFSDISILVFSTSFTDNCVYLFKLSASS